MIRVSKHLVEKTIRTAEIMEERGIRTMAIEGEASFFVTLDPRDQKNHGILYLGVARVGGKKYHLCQDIMS